MPDPSSLSDRQGAHLLGGCRGCQLSHCSGSLEHAEGVLSRQGPGLLKQLQDTGQG